MAYTIRRAIVLFASIVVMAFAIGGLQRGGGVAHIVADILCLVIGFYGLYGAWNLSHTHLKYFTILMVCLWIYMGIYILVTIITFHTHASKLLWDWLLLCGLFIGSIAAADLTWAVHGTDSLGESAHKPLLHV